MNFRMEFLKGTSGRRIQQCPDCLLSDSLQIKVGIEDPAVCPLIPLALQINIAAGRIRQKFPQKMKKPKNQRVW